MKQQNTLLSLLLPSAFLLRWGEEGPRILQDSLRRCGVGATLQPVEAALGQQQIGTAGSQFRVVHQCLLYLLVFLIRQLVVHVPDQLLVGKCFDHRKQVARPFFSAG